MNKDEAGATGVEEIDFGVLKLLELVAVNPVNGSPNRPETVTPLEWQTLLQLSGTVVRTQCC